MSRGLPVASLRASDDHLLATLREARWQFLRHPVAAQALFSALVAEGRAYARTPEGRALRQRLAASDLVRDLRVAWDLTTAEILQEDPPSMLPTAFLDALLQAASHPELEDLISRFQADDDDHTPP